MPRTSNWWSQSAFIGDYFFNGQRKVAHQLAEYIAKYYVGDGISELRPETDVSALLADSIRRFIHQEDFTLVRDDDMLADVDLSKSIKFKDLVNLLCLQRGVPA
jgi:hypothetical protein